MGEVEGGGDQFRPQLVAGLAQLAQLAAGADRLDPAEHLLDDFASALTPGVARVPGRASVNRAAPSALVLGHVRGDPQTAYIPDVAARVVDPIGADCGPPADAAVAASPGRPRARRSRPPRSARHRRPGRGGSLSARDQGSRAWPPAVCPCGGATTRGRSSTRASLGDDARLLKPAPGLSGSCAASPLPTGPSRRRCNACAQPSFTARCGTLYPTFSTLLVHASSYVVSPQRSSHSELQLSSMLRAHFRQFSRVCCLSDRDGVVRFILLAKPSEPGFPIGPAIPR